MIACGFTAGHTLPPCPEPAAWRITDADDPWVLQYACHGHRGAVEEAIERPYALPFQTPARGAS